MMFHGYIDESGNDLFFTLSCLLATVEDWALIEAAWLRILQQKNEELRKAGRPEVSRFHTADCSSRRGEFEGWSVAEQVELTKQLLDVFHTYATGSIAYTFPIADFKAVFPDNTDLYATMYGFLTKFIMMEIVNAIEGAGAASSTQIALFHDRNSHSFHMQSAFQHVMHEDPTFDKQKYFSTLTSIGWESCIPLQAADLIAYEIFKDVDNQAAKRKPRQSLLALKKSPAFSARSKVFDRSTIEMLWQGIASGEATRV